MNKKLMVESVDGAIPEDQFKYETQELPRENSNPPLEHGRMVRLTIVQIGGRTAKIFSDYPIDAHVVDFNSLTLQEQDDLEVGLPHQINL